MEAKKESLHCQTVREHVLLNCRIINFRDICDVLNLFNLTELYFEMIKRGST